MFGRKAFGRSYESDWSSMRSSQSAPFEGVFGFRLPVRGRLRPPSLGECHLPPPMIFTVFPQLECYFRGWQGVGKNHCVFWCFEPSFECFIGKKSRPVGIEVAGRGGDKMMAAGLEDPTLPSAD